MGERIRFKYRVLSIVMAAIMAFTMLPLSIITYAAQIGSKITNVKPDVYVYWQPAEENVKTGETGTVNLNASLNFNSESIVESAKVKISLTRQEVSALQQFRDENGNLDYDKTEYFDEGVSADIELRSDGGANICFVLDAQNPSLTSKLTFKSWSKTAAPFSIDVSDDDIIIFPTLKEGASGEPVLQKKGGSFKINASFNWEMAVEAKSENIKILNGSISDFAFSILADSQNKAETGVIYTQIQTFKVTLKLPEGIYLPQGDYSYLSSNGHITADSASVVSITGLPPDAVVRSVARTDTSTLEVEIVRTPKAFTKIAELPDLDCEIILFGSSLILCENEVSEHDARATLSVQMDAVSLAGSEYTCKRSAQEGIPVCIDSKKAENNTALCETTANTAKEVTCTETIQNSLISTQSGNNIAATYINEPEYIRIDSYHEAYSQKIFWVDNNNETGIRPSADKYTAPKLYFSMDGGGFKELTQANLADLGLSSYPNISIDARSGIGNYTLSIGSNTLPTQVTYIDKYGDEMQHTVEWKITPQQTNGYSLVEVTSDNLSEYQGISQTGWYYILNFDFSFYLRMRWGKLGQAPGISNAILEHFNVVVSVRDTVHEYKLSEIDDAIDIVIDPLSDPDNPTSGTMIINDVWKYNIDGSPISYSVEEINGGDGKITIPSLEKGDCFALSYDNSAAPNFGSVTDKIHSGGTMYLTLTGVKNYSADKVWLDGGSDEIKTGRPAGEFQLWRYRSGSSYTTAAPVRNADGTIVTTNLDTAQNDQNISHEALTKYDAEGYEYIYVVREYLDAVTVNGEDARSYEQVFGSVSEDGTIIDRVDADGELVDTTEPRSNGNTFLYDGGTISNRITDTVAASATKVWKAAAFQSEFENVKIELMLQSRVSGSEEEWSDTGEKEVVDGFFAENLSYTVSRDMPKYDMLGRALEYRWIEQAVYQGENSTDNLLTWFGDSGSFTLKQSGRDIKYRSVSEIQADNSTLITNSIANTIDYETIKIWLDADGEKIDAPAGANAVFNIYRTISGETLGEPVASFVMDGIADESKILVNEELGIYAQETEPWVTVVTPLDEYDGEGRQYEYILLEASSSTEFIPTYETTRDDDGYTTTVYNAPSGGNRIMVRKAWIDDSDILHRRPVTITVYNRYTNEAVNSITLGDGVWHDWVGIGNLKQEDVYILETKVGETAVPLTSYDINSDAEPNFTSPQMPDEYDSESDTSYTAAQYQTEYHYYEATYSREEIAGITFYTVTNRRLGNINLTVTKNWVDGDGENRQEIQAELERLSSQGVTLYPALRLQFAENDVPPYYEISRSGVDSPDYITVGNHDNRVPILDGNGKNVSSDIEIKFAEDTSEYKFFGLPKYDRNGSVVSYKVEEIWLDGDGAVIDIETIAQSYPELYELIKEYDAEYEETGYIVGHKRAADKQYITVTNRLSGTKSVMWHKQWNDDYVYSSGQRPDIYLNIYNEVHTSNNDTAVSLYIANYKWTYLEEDPADDPDGLYDKQLHWHAVLDGLPKYDGLGYEIKYFAVEHTSVNASDFDYLPVEYSVPVAVKNEENITSIGDEYEISSPDGMSYVRNVQEHEGSDIPYYALIEGGTFTNKIYQTIAIRGQKLWSSLPSGYPSMDLPTVKFTLYQQAAGSDEKKSIAALEVSDWASIYSNGSYIFRIEYIGKNTMTVDSDGNVIISGEEGASKLPKYDERGRIYNYVLEESSISWPNGDSPDSSNVYRDPIINTYLISNAYDSIKGALSVKKYLYLPLDENGLPKAYPAVNFELSRTYTKSDGSTSSKEIVDYRQWSSAEVKAAYEANKDDIAAGSSLEKVFTFENLDIYAPNGSEYNYTVTEVKDYLGGYDTWASAGDIAENDIDGILTAGNIVDSISNLAVTLNSDGGRGESHQNIAVAATFVNAPRDTDRETVILTGTKIWRDFNNAFQIRPQDISITLSRYANAQPGQGNQIAEASVDESAYKILWDKTEGGEWKYKIEGTAASELDAYAPNGMPWEYVVTERLPDGSVYKSSPANGRVGEKGQTGSEITMNNLTNSILTSISYSKSFVDTDGELISEDYLGFDISVLFELQVAELSDSNIGEWQSASNYFGNNLPDEIYNAVFEGYSFTQSLTGRINDTSVWGVSRSFTNLPTVIKKNGLTDAVSLTYRVVEKEIIYGDITQTVEAVNSADNKTYTYSFSSGLFSPAYWANGKTSAETDYNNSSTRSLYNRLQTADLTLTKQWLGDNDNIYSTRPATDRTGYDWEASFIVQRSTDNINWENVKLFTSAGTAKDLIVTLYGTDSDISVSETLTGLPLSDMSGNAYIYRIRELQINFTVSSGSVSENDILSDSGDIYNTAYTVEYPSIDTVSNSLNQISIYAVKKWNPSSVKVSVTLELQYKGADGAWKSFGRPAKITLDGAADTQSAYYEYEAWKAVWSGVPQSLPDSDLSKDGKTQYRVVEAVPSGYIVESSDAVEAGSGYPEYSFTNVESTSLSVEKKWYGISSGEQKTVVAGLWRTTGEIDGQGTEKVLDGSGNQCIIELSTSNGYKGVFTSLPKYDAAGNEYKYYARELTIGGIPANDAGYRIVNTDTSGKTVITNIGLMELIGSKIWKDNSNAYNTRPEDITLTLYRSIAGGNEMEVEASPMWKKDGDVWSYKYTGLPKTDDSGNAYTYRVEETAPENYTSSQDGNDITNTLTGTVDIPVTKIWRDNNNASGERPQTIEVVIYADGAEVASAEIGEDTGFIEGIWNKITGSADNEWEYIFEGMPKYNENGVEIVYTVAEREVPEDYEVRYHGFNIENVKFGGISVSKSVTGTAGEKDAYFNFIVELSDTSINGVYGEMKFVDGIAEFSLRDGEKITATGLNADIEYIVTELEADKDGYTTTSVSESGTIPAGDTANAVFTNHKDAPPLSEALSSPSQQTSVPSDISSDYSQPVDNVDTGDNFSLTIFAGLMIASLISMLSMLIYNRKRER